MMDCSQLDVFFKEYNRMCNFYGGSGVCKNNEGLCPLYSLVTCLSFVKNNTERAKDIVQKWSDGYPRESYKDYFLRYFPKATLNSDNAPSTCRALVFGHNCEKHDCVICWNEAYEEGETSE